MVVPGARLPQDTEVEPVTDDPLRHTWEQLEPQFRQEWEASYADVGLDWAEVREAHQFGWIMARRPEFADRSFEDVETDLRSHWYRPQLTSEETAWEIARVAAKDGWDKSRQRMPRQ